MAQSAKTPQTGDRKKAVGYTRVSTEEQVDGASREVQKQAILEYAKKHNLEISENDIYWDGGFSAKTANRPELQRMLTEIEDGTIKPDVVIVYNLSRISRNLMSFSGEIAPTFARHKVELRSTCEDINETPQGRFMTNLSIALHQLDNDTKSKTTSDNMKMVASEGYWQSHAPLGMVCDHVQTGLKTRDGKPRYRTVLKPDLQDDTAQKVKDVLDYFAEGDKGVAQTKRFADKIGLKTKLGKPLGLQGLIDLLSQPALAGYICSPTLTDGKYVKAQWDGLISLEQHMLILELLRGGRNPDQKQTYRRNNPDFPLKGTLICEHCGCAARGSSPRCGSGAVSPRYHCSECLGAGSIKPEKLHEKFIDLLTGLAPVKSLLRAFGLSMERAMKHSVEKAQKIVDEQEALIKQYEEQEEESFYLASTHQRSEADHNHLVAILQKKTKQAQQAIEEAKELKSISEHKIKCLVALMENPAEIWRGASLEVRQMLQKMIFPNGLTVNLKTGDFEEIGTNNISPLFSVISTKNGSFEPSYSEMVPGTRIELASRVAHAPKTCVSTNSTTRA